MIEEEDNTIESCNECDCHDEKQCDNGGGDDDDAQLQYYRDSATGAVNKQVAPNTVISGLNANPYRSSAIFCNIGVTILLIRSHPSNADPNVSGPTAIMKTLKAFETWEPDCKCYRRMLQGNICIVNTDTSITGAISIMESLSKPDTEPIISGGRYGNL
jgi:hypothetical protein